MNAFTTLTSRVVPLLINNVDTDQIIPARFLKATDKSGMGKHLFADWRFGDDGAPQPEFVLNKEEYSSARILLAGENFGCGSSREHAPWALVDYGFRAIVSTSFADIFRANAMKNGLLPVILEPQAYTLLRDAVDRSPDVSITIDLARQQVILPGGRPASFPIDGFTKACLLNGVDELGYLLSLEPEIAAFEQRRAHNA